MCWTCNGYYGSSLNDPLCSLCHSFLIPMDVSLPMFYFRIDINDTDDSGNDEPPSLPPASAEPFHLEPVHNQHRNQYDDYQSIPNNVAIEYFKQIREASEDRMEMIARDQESIELATLLQVLAHPAEIRNPIISDVEIGALPVEVLLHIFSFLDDITLWVVSEVSVYWRKIVEQRSPESIWRIGVQKRWPLFNSNVEVGNWFRVSVLCLFFVFIHLERKVLLVR